MIRAFEEPASSLEELTSIVKQNADNALQANSLARSASSIAGKGGADVSHVVQNMASINGASRQIADIIGVIDGIAFQTNILALNAAVEAARAGERGKGFDLVATEVRNLAQRSASAVEEVKALIEALVVKADAGTRLADEAGGAMREIVAGIQRVADLVSEIAAASQEQSAGIDQINRAVSQMEQVTQQNASLAEGAGAASSSMQDQAVALARIVSVFKLDQASKVERMPGLQPDPADDGSHSYRTLKGA